MKLLLAIIGLCLLCNQAAARSYNLMTVWVTIRAMESEDVWQACRRVYQRDVYKVRAAGPGKVSCNINVSRLNDTNGKVRSNFN